jgi:hypothetical protein
MYVPLYIFFFFFIYPSREASVWIHDICCEVLESTVHTEEGKENGHGSWSAAVEYTQCFEIVYIYTGANLG